MLSHPTILLSTFLVTTPTHAAWAQNPRATPAAIVEAVDALARRAVAAGLGPALGVAVVMDGRTILARSYGLVDVSAGIAADDRTLWYLASTSKSFTGFAASLLADEGRLRFDAPITTLLPQAEWPAGAAAQTLTLADFLAHTQGLGSGAVVVQAAYVGQVPEARWPELLQWSEPLPSRTLIYSNLGYNVAAMVIDALRPEGWRQFMAQRLYAPAGMTDTHARVSGLDPRRIAKPHTLRADGAFVTAPFFKVDATMNSAGGHLSTLQDLARWTIVQMDSGRIDGRQVFPQSAVERSHRMLARHEREQDRRFALFDREGWGAGWNIGRYEGERMVSRFGSYHSTRSHLSFLPARRVGVVAMANGGPGSRVTDIVAALVYDLEAGRPDALARAEARLAEGISARPAGLAQVAQGDSVRAARQAQPLPRGWDAYAGAYSHPGYGTISFQREGPGLAFRWGALDGPVEIFNAGLDQLRFEMAGSGTVARFRFGPSGPAAGVVVNGVELVREP
jgi:CubicO group peptidase (beta-lactamase class C family)